MLRTWGVGDKRGKVERKGRQNMNLIKEDLNTCGSLLYNLTIKHCSNALFVVCGNVLDGRFSGSS